MEPNSKSGDEIKNGSKTDENKNNLGNSSANSTKKQNANPPVVKNGNQAPTQPKTEENPTPKNPNQTNGNKVDKNSTEIESAKNEYNKTREQLNTLLKSLDESSDFAEIKEKLMQESAKIDAKTKANQTKDGYLKAKDKLEKAISEATKSKNTKQNEINKLKDETKEQFVPIAANQPEIFNSKELSDFLKKLKEQKSTKEINDLSDGFKKQISEFQEESKKYQSQKEVVNSWIKQNLNEDKYSEIKGNFLSEIDRINKEVSNRDLNKNKFMKAINDLNEKKQEAETKKKELESKVNAAISEVKQMAKNSILFELDLQEEHFTKLINQAKNTSTIDEILKDARDKFKFYTS
ncbi:hypothetical protein [Ureaplasma diversum]|nr:hypothetical protein [Ureaplasma diversum]